MSTLHVMGPPKDGMVGFDERTCNEPDYGEDTIFHIDPKVFANGDRICMSCGSLFFPKGERKTA